MWQYNNVQKKVLVNINLISIPIVIKNLKLHLITALYNLFNVMVQYHINNTNNIK